ncbi:hypothetical protein BKA61DRAFT_68714 [Leptodontidium sp. MPI-SDFR-AT-0119]|nr:hypothetical protein BKA61DRAFT_68714 [Leptodontidium sp. MPI-SDFR-AT-0119]
MPPSLPHCRHFRICFPPSQLYRPKIRAAGDPRLPTGGLPALLPTLLILGETIRVGMDKKGGRVAHDFISLLGRSQFPFPKIPLFPPPISLRKSLRTLCIPGIPGDPFSLTIRPPPRCWDSDSEAYMILVVGTFVSRRTEAITISVRNIRYRGKKRTLINKRRRCGQLSDIRTIRIV